MSLERLNPSPSSGARWHAIVAVVIVHLVLAIMLGHDIENYRSSYEGLVGKRVLQWYAYAAWIALALLLIKRRYGRGLPERWIQYFFRGSAGIVLIIASGLEILPIAYCVIWWFSGLRPHICHIG